MKLSAYGKSTSTHVGIPVEQVRGLHAAVDDGPAHYQSVAYGRSHRGWASTAAVVAGPTARRRGCESGCDGVEAVAVAVASVVESHGGSVAVVEVPPTGEANHLQQSFLNGKAARGDLVRHQHERAHLR